MNKITLEERYVLEYIKDMLDTYKMKSIDIYNARYHHNVSYLDAPSIINYGILSIKELHKLGIKSYSQEYLKIMDDTTSHVNGTDAISLSVVGLDDIYPNEDEYNPFSKNMVDILISSDIRTSRSSVRYGNEFLSYQSISPEYFRAVDIRFLELIDSACKENNIKKIRKIVENYNNLKSIAQALNRSGLNIPLREMSTNDNRILDTAKLATTPQLLLKQ